MKPSAGLYINLLFSSHEFLFVLYIKLLVSSQET